MGLTSTADFTPMSPLFSQSSAMHHTSLLRKGFFGIGGATSKETRYITITVGFDRIVQLTVLLKLKS